MQWRAFVLFSLFLFSLALPAQARENKNQDAENISCEDFETCLAIGAALGSKSMFTESLFFLRMAQQYKYDDKFEVDISEAIAMTHSFRGHEYLFRGALYRALLDYEASLEILSDDPDQQTTLDNRGLIYMLTGDKDSAIRSLEDALALGGDAEDVNTYNNYSYVFYNQGDYKSALDMLQKAIEKDNKNIVVYSTFAQVYIALGDVEKARDALSRVSARFDEEPNSYDMQALRMIYEAIEKTGKLPDPEDIRSKASDAYKNEKYNDAAILYLAQYFLEPRNAVAAYNAAISLMKAGAPGLSVVQYYHVYLQLDPEREDREKVLMTMYGAVDKPKSPEDGFNIHISESDCESFLNAALGAREAADYPAAFDLAINGRECELVRNSGGETDMSVFALILLGNMHAAISEYDKAALYYDAAMESTREIYDQDHPYIGSIYTNKALLAKAAGDFDTAIDYYNISLDIVAAASGEDSVEYAVVVDNAGNLLQEMGRYDEAIEYHLEALDIFLKEFGENHQDTATAYNNIANAYMGKGEPEKAFEYFEKALAVTEEAFGKNHPSTAILYDNMGKALSLSGDHGQALEYHERALDIFKKTLGPNNMHVSIVYGNMGDTYYRKGAYEEAIECYESMLEIAIKVFDEAHPLAISAYEGLSRAYRALGDDEKADAYEKMLPRE